MKIDPKDWDTYDDDEFEGKHFKRMSHKHKEVKNEKQDYIQKKRKAKKKMKEQETSRMNERLNSEID